MAEQRLNISVHVHMQYYNLKNILIFLINFLKIVTHKGDHICKLKVSNSKRCFFKN